MKEDHSGVKRGALMAAALILAVVAAGAGIWLGSDLLGGDDRLDPGRMKAATLLPSPKPLTPFELVDQDALPYGTDRLTGHWTFVSFGYTSCPDVCPTTMAAFDALARRLDAAGAGQTAEFLFVSVDPERDPPRRLAQYVRYFNPSFLGATGSHDQLRSLTRQLGVLYARAEGQDTAMSYLVDHSASVLLLDPKARLAAIFSAPHDVDAMAADFADIAGQWDRMGDWSQ